MANLLIGLLILIGSTVFIGFILMAIYAITVLHVEGDISMIELLKRVRRRSWEHDS